MLHMKRRDTERHDQPRVSTAVQLLDSNKQSDLFTLEFKQLVVNSAKTALMIMSN